jgi:hypothetical protein
VRRSNGDEKNRMRISIITRDIRLSNLVEDYQEEPEMRRIE